MQRLKVGILIFDGVEVLDFTGPFEVFSRTRTEPGPQSRRSEDSAPFDVFLAAQNAGVVHATGGLQVLPHHDFVHCPAMDILVIPGGFGTRPLLEAPPVLDWIRRSAEHARYVTSVCTGSLLLAKAGLLRNRRATTHWAALDLLASLDSSIVVEREKRVVEDGVITSAGVSSGMDMAFHLVERICGAAVAEETARYIEFHRSDRLAGSGLQAGLDGARRLG